MRFRVKDILPDDLAAPPWWRGPFPVFSHMLELRS
jgi:hypothetical protein